MPDAGLLLFNAPNPGRRCTVGYYTRVLSKQEDFLSFEELSRLISAEHPEYKLTVEDGSEEEWESLLLSGKDEVEVALLERHPVTDGSLGQDEIAEFIEETQDCKPESGVQWLGGNRNEENNIFSFSLPDGCGKRSVA